ncbi:hypothetical protein HY498_05105 [Candidatus Woesearchaeota archaeon]|nr:hypothetical protein [Candidatus Woesearchaeota archaeon]
MKKNIAKEVYEKHYSTQKYESSALYNTYDEDVQTIIFEAKKEVFDDIEKECLLNSDTMFISNIKEFEGLMGKIKQRHLSTPSEELNTNGKRRSIRGK